VTERRTQPPRYEKLVLVTRRTRLEELIERFNTHGQARFYIEHAGGDFRAYEDEHEVYRAAVTRLQSELAVGPTVHVIDRGFVPNYLFTEHDLVVTVGQDGLVANTAKYVGPQPIVAVNPDPARVDGVLLPWSVDGAADAVRSVIADRAATRQVTLAEAFLNDGQRLLAFNDLFIGPRTHQSARYELRWAGRVEVQSSSGIIVSTGAGSTGWLSSLFNMASGVAAYGGGAPPAPVRLPWEDPRLVFVVREPFVSRTSGASVVAGALSPGEELVLESRMPANGVIFSDGIEADYLAFNSGSIASIRAASQRAVLVVPA
jgi:NAD kinase